MIDSSINDPTRTALVLVDPFNDFLSEEGKVWPRIREVAEHVGTRRNLRDLLSAVRAAGIAVVIAPHRRFRAGDFDDWLRLSRAHRTIRDGRIAEVGTPGGDWYPDLAPRDGEVVATEHWGMDGFMHTDLDLQLSRRGVEHVILAGLTAPGCVEGTGRHAVELGYSVTLVKDATAAFTAEYLHAAVDLNAPLYAENIVTTSELVAALRPAAAPAANRQTISYAD